MDSTSLALLVTAVGGLVAVVGPAIASVITAMRSKGVQMTPEACGDDASVDLAQHELLTGPTIV